MLFSNDSDILKYEAVLFSELYFPWQVLCEGVDGELSGTSFSVSAGSFDTAGIAAGGAIYLRSTDGQLEGCFEIVSVDSATELTVSVLRSEQEGPAISPPSGGSGLSYRISTFAPQANEVSFELTRYFGIGPGNPESAYDTEDIVDVSVLRQASVYAVLGSVYATLGSRSGEQEYWKRSLYYRRLFENARERCRLGVDIDGDGVTEITRTGGSIRLVRQ